MSATSTAPWVEKYRPKTLDDLIAHEHIISTINRLIAANRLPHLLLYGPPGTGKTSTILACAKTLYGSSYKRMTLELNASDDRGIATVRNAIKNFAGTRELFSKGVKLIILDEADAMTSDAQFALRRIMEQYSGNARFCLICNYVSRIIPALQSRCTRFRFAPLKRSQIEARLNEIVLAEHLNVKPDGLKAILSLAGGDMRRVLNILQAASLSYSEIDAEAIYATTGDPRPADVEDVYHSLLNDTFANAHAKIRGLQIARGVSLRDLVTVLARLVAATKLEPRVRINLFTELSDLEFRLDAGVAEKTQIGALIGAFSLARADSGSSHP